MTPVGARIRQLREQKGLSQGDIETRTGLMRCYISRVENGHTVPSLETLERIAGALEVPFYRFFYTGDDPPATAYLTMRKTLEERASQDGGAGAEKSFPLKLCRLLLQVTESDREALLVLAQRMAADS